MKLDRLQFRIRNLQLGATMISNRLYERKVSAYREEYAKRTPEIQTNMRVRLDYSLRSLCWDRVIEDFLQSGKYTFHKIGIFINPFLYTPRTAVLIFKAPVLAGVQIKVVSGMGSTVYEDYAQPRQYHRISVTGLENGTNEISLTLTNRKGNPIRSRKIHIFLAHVPEPEENPMVGAELGAPSAYRQIFITGGDEDPFIFNANGTLFHTFQFSSYRTATYGVYPFEEGRFLWPVRNVGAPSFANPHSALLYEMDFMGRIYRTYHVKNGIHHFVSELPNGNLLTFSSSNERYSDRIKEGHTEDLLIEMDRKSGSIVRKIYLKDIFGTEYADQVDWIHANALEYNAEEDSLLICMRNIHSVIKLNWSTLEVEWLLSLPRLWKGTRLEKKVLEPIGNVQYGFQAHAAYEITNFRGNRNGYRFYMLFDNHRLNRRPIEGYEEDGHSYINIYGVNEKEHTVRMIKHLPIDLSIVRSNARYDVTHNRIFNMSGCMSRDYTDYRGKVEEYDHDTNAKLNSWYIRKDFFSGYGFKWKSDDYCTPLGLCESYRYECGEADVPVPVSKERMTAGKLMDPTYFDKPFIEEGYLYFYTKDHSIDALVLEGRRECFERDYTDTWQTTAIHVNRTYYCVVSLKELPHDSYRVKVAYDNTLYDTGYYIAL